MCKQHTSGPWYTEAYPNPRLIFWGDSTGDIMIGTAWESNNVGMIGSPEANAQLMATSPELLEACELALTELKRHHPRPSKDRTCKGCIEIIQRLTYVIAKATMEH